MIKEFISALGLERIIKDTFKTTDTAIHRDHKDHENLLQMIYQIFGTYYEDNCADDIRKDPVLSAILGKQALASQPTISRFFNRMDDVTLRQFDALMRELRKTVYSIELPEYVLFDIDSTLLPTYGKPFLRSYGDSLPFFQLLSAIISSACASKKFQSDF